MLHSVCFRSCRDVIIHIIHRILLELKKTLVCWFFIYFLLIAKHYCEHRNQRHKRQRTKQSIQYVEKYVQIHIFAIWLSKTEYFFKVLTNHFFIVYKIIKTYRNPIPTTTATAKLINVPDNTYSVSFLSFALVKSPKRKMDFAASR